MINVDTLGLDKPNIDYRSDDYLKCVASVIAEKMDVGLSSARMSQTTGDWQPFKREGIPILNLHSLDRQSIKRVHTSKDKRRAISDNDLNGAWNILLNLQRYLDQALSAQELKVWSN
jgi:hypothetical protein